MTVAELLDPRQSILGILGALQQALDLAARPGPLLRVHHQQQVLADGGFVVPPRLGHLGQLGGEDRFPANGLATLPVELRCQIDLTMTAQQHRPQAVAGLVGGIGRDHLPEDFQSVLGAPLRQQVGAELAHLVQGGGIAPDPLAEQRDQLVLTAVDAIEVEERVLDSTAVGKLAQQPLADLDGAGAIVLPLAPAQLQHARVQALLLFGAEHRFAGGGRRRRAPLRLRRAGRGPGQADERQGEEPASHGSFGSSASAMARKYSRTSSWYSSGVPDSRARRMSRRSFLRASSSCSGPPPWL